jgi:hypothetical protein
MELSPWEAASRSAAQEFSNILSIQKVQYHVHKGLPMVPASSQINPGHATCPCFSKNLFNIILPPTCSIPSGLFPPLFPTRILYEKLESGILHEN